MKFLRKFRRLFSLEIVLLINFMCFFYPYRVSINNRDFCFSKDVLNFYIRMFDISFYLTNKILNLKRGTETNAIPGKNQKDKIKYRIFLFLPVVVLLLRKLKRIRFLKFLVSVFRVIRKMVTSLDILKLYLRKILTQIHLSFAGGNNNIFGYNEISRISQFLGYSGFFILKGINE